MPTHHLVSLGEGGLKISITASNDDKIEVVDDE
jgi:hypothetical protein